MHSKAYLFGTLHIVIRSQGINRRSARGIPWASGPSIHRAANRLSRIRLLRRSVMLRCRRRRGVSKGRGPEGSWPWPVLFMLSGPGGRSAGSG
jgi:hypothetical protein